MADYSNIVVNYVGALPNGYTLGQNGLPVQIPGYVPNTTSTSGSVSADATAKVTLTPASINVDEAVYFLVNVECIGSNGNATSSANSSVTSTNTSSDSSGSSSSGSSEEEKPPEPPSVIITDVLLDGGLHGAIKSLHAIWAGNKFSIYGDAEDVFSRSLSYLYPWNVRHTIECFTPKLEIPGGYDALYKYVAPKEAIRSIFATVMFAPPYSPEKFEIITRNNWQVANHYLKVLVGYGKF